MTSQPEWVDFPSSVAYRKNEAIGAFEWVYRTYASGLSDAERFAKILNSCQGLIIRVGVCSEFELSKDQVYEIAYGVELSGLPFLWALRKPSWAILDLDALPLGFSQRTCGKGIVNIGWAPQIEILGHPSIGGSLFHSGWGSVIETLEFGQSNSVTIYH
ncbi:hypothetical protein GH714_020393 [Hevea brasiliensis]|uniref:Uncharacterized protein n=1 Tax=Hevea brasiliensis TaxID=3981 RepID=A0A6A6KQ66_HEVBR|nr:hypothetical protein GH714_020393 [Hevea brasiliensis]